MFGRHSLAFWRARRLGRVPADTTPPPTLTSYTPSDAMAGEMVEITGTNFLAVAPRPDAGANFVDSVWFGTVRAASFTVISDTLIRAIAAGPIAGIASVVVNTSGGCALTTNVAVTFRILAEDGRILTAENNDRLRIE